MPIIEERKSLLIGQAVGQCWIGNRLEGKFWILHPHTNTKMLGDHVKPDGTTQEIAWWFDTREEVDAAIKLYDQKHRSLDWKEELVALVGNCIEQQRRGFDVLASAAWDRVVDHWGGNEVSEQS